MLGVGLAALGRPGYITLDHAQGLDRDYCVAAMERRCHEVLDAAWAGGVRWFDAARSYGRAEQFLASWLGDREGALVSSKWGYRYVADWQVSATHHEIKDHSLAAFERQLAESLALLGDHLSLYQIHSVTPDSHVLEDRAVLAALAQAGVPIGLSVSGPRQREMVERALDVTIEGRPVFSAVQATWNLLERAVEPALREAKARGWRVIIKEGVANGRLATRAPQIVREEAARRGVGSDAIALAVANAQPFVDVVLSGAVTTQQLASNLLATTLIDLPDVSSFAALIEPPEQYWAERAQLAWN